MRTPELSGLLLLLLSSAAFALTVEVKAPDGAPRIVVDGQPVRGRMFWGGNGSAPLPLPASAQLIEAEFIAVADEPKTATMHFRFGSTPGEIILDDVQVTDLDTGIDVIPACGFEDGQDSFTKDWTFWPTGDDNTVAKVEVTPKVGRDGSAGLKITLSNPKQGGWPDWHIYHHANLSLVKGHRYRIRCWAQATPARSVKLQFYRPGRSFTFLGGPGGVFLPQVKLAGQADVPFVSFPCPMPWPTDDEPADFSSAEQACEQVLVGNPNALLIPRIGMAAPSWWLDAHPEAVMQWEGGSHRRCEAIASPDYQRDAAARLQALVEHLEAKFPDRMAGYHPCGQNTGEWFYVDTWQHHLNGYSGATETAFRSWLGEQYASDDALRAAWHDQAVTRATAKVPAAEARFAAPAGILRDPRTEQNILDFNRFQQEAMASWVCRMAAAIKRGCERQKLAVFFYGYVYEFSPASTGPATAGHYDLKRCLECPDIDVLCSPISYWDRGPGGTAPTMTAAESVSLSGKVWLNEDDTHTYLATEKFPGWNQHVDTLWMTNQLLIRNVAQEACRNLATWWMDLGSSGWFNDPGMWTEMKRMAPMDQWFLDHPTRYRPDVAAIVDERAMIAGAAGSQAAFRGLVYESRASFGRAGAPFGQYLQDDVAAGKVPAKLLVFLSPWRLTAPERAKLLAATKGRTRVWCYAPGWIDGLTNNLAAMKELTGFDLQPVTGVKAQATPTAAGQALGLTAPIGPNQDVKPLFKAVDAGPAEVLATWSDGSAAIALRQTPDGLSVFVGTPALSSELLRALADKAGVHLYTRTDCQVYANGPIVALHGAVDGPVEVDLGSAGQVVDALSGEPVGTGPKLTIELQRGETKVLRK